MKTRTFRKEGSVVMSVSAYCPYCKFSFDVPIYSKKYNKTATHMLYFEYLRMKAGVTPCVVCPKCNNGLYGEHSPRINRRGLPVVYYKSGKLYKKKPKGLTAAEPAQNYE